MGHLGKSCQEVWDKLTHRQYRTLAAWLDEQWNHPTRSDHYLMQIAQEVRRVLAKDKREIKLEHFKLPFKRAEKRAPEDPATKKARITAWSKARWFGILGIKEKPTDGN